jgi:hypothetical protein
MKILHVADFSSSFYGEPAYKSDGMLRDGFQANGHDVRTFSYRTQRDEVGQPGMESRLVDLASVFKPNLIVVGYGDGFTSDTFSDLRDASPKAKIAHWYGDARPELEGWVVELAGASDLFMTTAGGKILSDYKERSGCPKVAFFPNLVNLNLYRPCQFSKVRGSIIFTGGNYGESVRALSVDILSSSYGDAFITYGWNGGRVLGANYALVLSQSDFGLAVSAFHDRDKMQSCRTLEYMASGICTLVKRVPRVEELLGEGTCLYFDDPYEIPSLVEGARGVSRGIGYEAIKHVGQFSHIKIARYVVDEAMGDAVKSMYGEWVEVVK